MNQPPSGTIAAVKTTYRVESIDLLRGIIMIVMALDHVRDYFHYDNFFFSPTDLSKTNVFLFGTRWITHFCAPTFMFLSGMSAFLVAQRKGKKYTSRFLLTRGLFLIFLEFTVSHFGWYFNFYPQLEFLVIWALGISMVILSVLIYIPHYWLLGISLTVIFLHNLLDGIVVPGDNIKSFLWALVHQLNFFQFAGKPILVGYPIVPWFAVMSLGYCVGKIFTASYPPVQRRKILVMTGVACIVVFGIFRYMNDYGDPAPWQEQTRMSFSIMSFFNVTKYPPSLLFLLITLGPALIFLGITDNPCGWLKEKISVYGRVPMFYYLIHIYVVHLLAMLATLFTPHTFSDFILTTFISFEPKLKGFGFSLGIVYLVWISVVLLLYLPCKWYDRYKRAHPEKKWLSYL